jgi:nucleoside diphosphate kinase
METPGPYYAALAAFCAVCLVIGFAGAADQEDIEKIPCPKNWTGKDSDRAGHPPSADQMIARIEERGIDVTEVKAALQAGDDDAVKAWFANHGRPDKDENKRIPDVAAIIERFEQKGVNVTEVKNTLANGDTDAVKAWFASHRGEGGNGAGFPPLEGRPRHRAGENCG